MLAIYKFKHLNYLWLKILGDFYIGFKMEDSGFFSQIVSVAMYFIDLALNIDVHLKMLVENYGTHIYIILFIIVFCETGLVATPFLPGDSLLFAGGTLVGLGLLDYVPLVAVLLSAAILGDAVNYRIGRYIGPPVFEKDYRFLKRKHLLAAQGFYERHGGKAIVLARFIPIIRTFAPFVAGVASMNAARFTMFNVLGACLWVFLLVTVGWLLGNMPFVQKNFSLIIYLIILISVTPIVVEGLRAWLRSRKAGKNTELSENPSSDAKD